MSDSAVVDLSAAILAALVEGWPVFAAPPFNYPDLAALPDRRYVWAGPLPAYDCEQVVVAVERTFGSEGNPSLERIVPISDGVPYLRTLVAGIHVIRCITDFTADSGSVTGPGIATAATMTKESNAILTDVDVVLECLIRAQNVGKLAGCGDLALENWRATTAQGGLAGGITRVRLNLF